MGYSKLKNELVSAANGVDYAYRDTGGGEDAVPLVLLQHFRGNLDNWDPALIDALATARRVVTFDNAGVGGSTGTTPDTIEQMARDALAFLAAMGISQADLLGFSIGSFVAQQITLTRPAITRRLVLASAAPQGAAGMHGWAPEVIGAIGTRQTSPEAYLGVFFTPSAASRQAGQEALRRMYARTEDRDKATTWATRDAQYDAVCTWGIPDHARLQRAQCHRHAGVRRERRQRPDDPAPLLPPARRPDPGCPRENLPRLGARLPVPASRRVRRRRRGLSGRSQLKPS